MVFFNPRSDLHHCRGHYPAERGRAFALPTPESVRYFTRFDKEGLSGTIRFLSGIRAVVPPLYRTLTYSTARRKAVAEEPEGETVVLTAVAVGAALEADSGCLAPGAGLLSELTDLSSVLE